MGELQAPPVWLKDKLDELNKSTGPQTQTLREPGIYTFVLDVSQEPIIGGYNRMTFFTTDNKKFQLPPGAARTLLDLIGKGIYLVQVRVSDQGFTRTYTVEKG